MITKPPLDKEDTTMMQTRVHSWFPGKSNDIQIAPARKQYVVV